MSALLRSVYRAVAPHPLRSRIAAARQRLRHRGMGADPQGKRSLERLAAYRDRFAGQPCVILGNGPSLKDFDLDRLRGLKTFCLNRGYLLWNDQHLAPDFLVAVNDLVIQQFSAELRAVEAEKFIPWLYRAQFPAADDDIVYFEERWDETFSRDARDGIATTATVTNSALQLAYHFGFSTVILLGIDHSFAAPGKPHQKVLQQSADVDHFRPDYFAPGTSWHLPDLAQSERGYSKAKAAYEADGRRIVNATPGTRLDIFPRADLDSVLAAVR